MDLKPDARRVLKLAKAARTPSADDKARVERSLAAALGTGAALTAGTALGHSVAAAKPVAGSGLYAWMAGALLVGAVITGYFMQASEPRARPSRAPRVALDTPAPLAPETIATQAAPSAAPSADAPVARARASHPRSRASTSAEELALLQRAQLAWREASAQRALELLAQHRHAYPRSQLALERDALRVLALCQLGERDHARPLAQALFARNPQAPMRAAIEQSCALK
ncbi:MAG TPA: hypothetical protein VFZ61_04780 [Polyangiales bacterium]